MYGFRSQVRRITIPGTAGYTEGPMKKDLTAEAYLDRLLTADAVAENCPMRRTLTMLSGKWRTYVIYALCKQPSLRFGELKRAIPGITNTMLSATLRDLEALGIVSRRQYNEIPPRVEYALTGKGAALLPVFTELARWGEAHLGDEP